jgi:UDP-N-acetyl-D-mannosaminuronic acid dehydrogenase
MTRDAFEGVVVVGCGSIGLPLAAAFASRGVAVLGYDLDTRLIGDLSANRIRRTDEGLADAIADGVASGRLVFRAALAPADSPRAFILAVPTPSMRGPPGNDAGFDDQPLQSAVRAVAAVARPGDAICVRSTAPVGTCAAIAGTLARSGHVLDVVSTPDRSIEGRAFQEQFAIPHMVGAVDVEAAARVEALFGRLGPTVVCDGANVAEAAKLLCNVVRDVMFGLANEVADLCDTLGLDGREVCAAAGENYPRFSLPRPGPVGGPCLLKDADLLRASAGAPPLPLIEAGRAANLAVIRKVAGGVLAHMADAPGAPVALLGVAYKGWPPVADVRGSPALAIADCLRNAGVETIVGWDPVIEPEALRDVGLIPAPSALAAAAGAAAVILANNHAALGALDLEALFATAHPRALVYDLCGQTSGRRVRPSEGQELRVLGGGTRLGSRAP